jgi:hypothetical protein
MAADFTIAKRLASAAGSAFANAARSALHRLVVLYAAAVMAAFTMAFVGVLAVLVMHAATGNGHVRNGGTTDGVRYWVKAGKPPRPREVGAVYYHVASAVEATALYGVTALLTLVTTAAIVGGVTAACRDLVVVTLR